MDNTVDRGSPGVSVFGSPGKHGAREKSTFLRLYPVSQARPSITFNRYLFSHYVMGVKIQKTFFEVKSLLAYTEGSTNINDVIINSGDNFIGIFHNLKMY